MALGARQLPDLDTANGQLFDTLVRHQVYIMRYNGHVRNRIQSILDASEGDIADKIERRLKNARRGVVEEKRLQTLLGIVRNIRTKAWSELTAEWVAQYVELSKHEAVFMSNAVVASSPVVVQTVAPAASQLKAIVSSRPFQGRLLREWAKTTQSDDLARINNAIRLGMLEGDTPKQIARRVVGTAKLRGVDGVTEITRRNAAAITRTATNHIANQARREWLNENADILDGEKYVAVLDNRTTPICMSLDGQVFKLGQGSYPPMHIQCRSLRVPYFDGDRLGQRPAKASTERMLLREFSEQHKLKRPTSRAGLPRGTKGSYDAFKRKRVRELTGRVPGETSYQNWLTKQTTEFQDDVLGVTKGKLFRKGGLKLDKFVNRNGDELNLAQLAQREAAAFKAAGLDPARY